MVVPDKKRLFYLSWLTLLGMSAMGIVLITYLQKKDAYAVFTGGKNYYVQFTSGLVFGGIASVMAVILLNNGRFGQVRAFFSNLLGEIQPSFANIVFYSFCAAVGEEVLFRAGIQPFIGIWPAAMLFVFLHGYINPYNLILSIYGIFLVVICSGFGYLFDFFGIGSCITAHFVYDVSMFSLLKYSYQRQNGNNAANAGQTPESGILNGSGNILGGWKEFFRKKE